MDIREFQQKQQLPYEAKIAHAEVRAWEFYRKITGEYGADCHVSVGGLDSITLLCFLRSIGIDVPAVSVSILEDKGKIRPSGSNHSHSPVVARGYFINGSGK